MTKSEAGWLILTPFETAEQKFNCIVTAMTKWNIDSSSGVVQDYGWPSPPRGQLEMGNKWDNIHIPKISLNTP